MKNFLFGVIVILGLVLILIHSKPAPAPEPVAVTTPTPTPVPTPAATPNPARGAIQAAIRMYPDLGKKDSTFNLMFIDVVEQRKKSDPASLVSAEWPLAVADEVGRRLGIYPLPISSPAPAVAAQSPTPKYDDPLGKGAYDAHKGVVHVWPPY